MAKLVKDSKWIQEWGKTHSYSTRSFISKLSYSSTDTFKTLRGNTLDRVLSGLRKEYFRTLKAYTSAKDFSTLYMPGVETMHQRYFSTGVHDVPQFKLPKTRRIMKMSEAQKRAEVYDLTVALGKQISTLKEARQNRSALKSASGKSRFAKNPTWQAQKQLHGVSERYADLLEQVQAAYGSDRLFLGLYEHYKGIYNDDHSRLFALIKEGVNKGRYSFDEADEFLQELEKAANIKTEVIDMDSIPEPSPNAVRPDFFTSKRITGGI